MAASGLLKHKEEKTIIMPLNFTNGNSGTAHPWGINIIVPRQIWQFSPQLQKIWLVKLRDDLIVTKVTPAKS